MVVHESRDEKRQYFVCANHPECLETASITDHDTFEKPPRAAHGYTERRGDHA